MYIPKKTNDEIKTNRKTFSLVSDKDIENYLHCVIKNPL